MRNVSSTPPPDRRASHSRIGARRPAGIGRTTQVGARRCPDCLTGGATRSRGGRRTGREGSKLEFQVRNGVWRLVREDHSNSECPSWTRATATRSATSVCGTDRALHGSLQVRNVSVVVRGKPRRQRLRARVGQRHVSFLPVDPVHELAHPAAERSPHLGQAPRAEDEQEQDHEQHDLLDSDEPRHRYWPRLAGSTPANVKKSFIWNDDPAEVSVGVHFGFCTRYDAVSLWSSPISTSATIRPPTGPRWSPSSTSSASLST